MTAPDPDPLYVPEDFGEQLVTRGTLPRSLQARLDAIDGGADILHCGVPGCPLDGRALHRYTADPPDRSGAVILYLAVILVAIATGAIIALLWWGLR